jgi:hypothetical protein
MFPSGGWDYELVAAGVRAFLGQPLSYAVFVLVMVYGLLPPVIAMLRRIVLR